MARATVSVPLFIQADDNAKRNAWRWGGLWRVYRTPNGNYQSLSESAIPVEHSVMLHAYRVLSEADKGWSLQRFEPDAIPASVWFPDRPA